MANHVYTVKVGSDTYTGRSWDSIARRVWGRTCFIRVGTKFGNGVWEGLVLKPYQNAYNVQARVILWED